MIRAPSYIQGSADNPVTALPSVDLLPVGGDRYEGTYNWFNSAGTYQVAIYARDKLGNTSVPKVTTVTVANPIRRKAVIVAGGPQSDPQWPAIRSNAGLAYEALTFQGYTDDDIYFLSPETFVAGVDVPPTLANLWYALDTWAKSSTYDLVLYMVGKGGYEIFQMETGQVVEADDLDAKLDSLQGVIPGKVTLIYDACGSGSFMPLMTLPSGKERILIASTTGSQSVYFLSEGDISFSRFFWSRILNGADVRTAFLHSKDAIVYACKGQTPQLDDNGNGVSNEQKIDGLVASHYTIGVGVMLAGDDPIIGSVCDAQNVVGDASATLWAENVTTTGTIQKVWAVITPPGYGPGLCETPEEYLPSVVMNHVGGGRYEGSYAAFSDSGSYGVAIHAMDSEGNTSPGKETAVSYTGLQPSLTTAAVFPINTTSATGGGNITSDGGPSVIARGICWAVSTAPTTSNRHTSDGVGTGSFQSELTGLSPGTTYHVRAYATNSVDTSYGNEVTFTTLATTASVGTAAASQIGSTSAKSGGTVYSDGGASVTVRGVCWATTSNPSLSNVCSENGEGTGSFTSDIIGLTPATTYHVRAYATNSKGTSYGNDVSFSTPAGAPEAATGAAGSVTSSGATLNGTVNPNGASTTVTFEYGTTTSYGNTVTATQSPVTGTNSQAVSRGITGLTPGTTYHYRVKGMNVSGTNTGSDQSFTTAAAVPTATTGAAGSVSSREATLNGTVNPNGASTAVTFEYGTKTSYGTTVTSTQSPVTGTSSQAVSKGIAGLTPGTTYHYCVKASNAAGAAAGSDQSFTTETVLPTVVTGAATEMGTESARLTGTVNPNGVSAQYYFEYGRSGVYGTATANTDAGNGSSAVAVSAPINGLDPGAEYHYRLVGTSNGGTSYGSNQSFKTGYASVVFVHPTDTTCGGNSPCCTSIQAAIDTAETGYEVRISGGAYTESFELNTPKLLTLSGRWNDRFTDQNGAATVIKAPRAPQGSLTLQNVNVVP